MKKTLVSIMFLLGWVLTNAASAMGNPASINCIKMGGQSQIVGSVGYCQFPNGTRCEEWALFRGTCSANKSAPKPMPPIGGARGKGGCLIGAGVVWCNATNRCERPWILAKQKGFPLSPNGFKRFCRN